MISILGYSINDIGLFLIKAFSKKNVNAKLIERRQESVKSLKVIGKEKIGSIEFTGIEGGFGKDKKAMLVKDIAVIHSTTVGRINGLINRNIKRFKSGIDFIDLKNGNFAIVLNESKFSQNQINATKNIYLLSERGYAKLLKILDDRAWEIYDELVDNYFNMRVAINNNQPH